mgnify:FL=1
MKKLLLLSFILCALMGCESNSDEDQSSDETPLLAPTVEGKWLYDVTANLPNTMYEFRDGTRYTYYSDSEDFSVEYWGSLNTADAIPGTHEYTFQNDTLTIDLNFGNVQILPLIFECDGDRINFQDPESSDRYNLVRLGSDCN